MEATSLDVHSLSEFILNTLRKNGIDPECIVSQGYDGASVMSGHYAGILFLMLHMCTAMLNLVLVDSTKRVSEASDFFSLMETLYVFLSRSVMHAISSRNSLNYSQTILKDNCRDFQIPDGLVGS